MDPEARKKLRRQEIRAVMKDRTLGREEKRKRLAELRAEHAAPAPGSETDGNENEDPSSAGAASNGSDGNSDGHGVDEARAMHPAAADLEEMLNEILDDSGVDSDDGSDGEGQSGAAPEDEDAGAEHAAREGGEAPDFGDGGDVQAPSVLDDDSADPEDEGGTSDRAGEEETGEEAPRSDGASDAGSDAQASSVWTKALSKWEAEGGAPVSVDGASASGQGEDLSDEGAVEMEEGRAEADAEATSGALDEEFDVTAFLRGRIAEGGAEGKEEETAATEAEPTKSQKETADAEEGMRPEDTGDATTQRASPEKSGAGKKWIKLSRHVSYNIAEEPPAPPGGNETPHAPEDVAEGSSSLVERCRRSRWQIVSLILLAVIVCIGAILGVVISRGDEEGSASQADDSWPSGGSNAKEDDRLQRTLAYLAEEGVSDPSSLELWQGKAEGQWTPQVKAARWISQDDPREIPIPLLSPSALPSSEEGNAVICRGGLCNAFLQRYSLAVLFFATGGPYWQWKMHFITGLHECLWFDEFRFTGMTDTFTFGVYCDRDAGSLIVEEVMLPPSNNMIGTLPSEVRHLRYLEDFTIQHNDGIVGTIPFQYGWLNNLRHLDLMHTSLSGRIPPELSLLDKLQTLRLTGNNLSGDSSAGDLDFLSKMTSLTHLLLDYNGNITGTLPDLSELSRLEYLVVSNTAMHGTLPVWLPKLTQLRRLFLDDCSFEGNVDVLRVMTNLTHVVLEDNSFEGRIDDTFFSGLEKLVVLDLSGNSFSGFVPSHFFHLPQLIVLDLSDNKLVGTLPEGRQNSGLQSAKYCGWCIWKSTSLTCNARVVFLTNQYQLTEEQAQQSLVERGECIDPDQKGSDGLSIGAERSRLEYLSLHNNSISGSIPMSLMRELTDLTTLDLSMNQFTSFPSTIGDLPLEILFLGRNEFYPNAVPTWLRGMTQLKELSLKSSSLEGTIPSWIGELTNLAFLDLGENDLSGTVPQATTSLNDLMVLMLNSNRLEGPFGYLRWPKLETLLIDDNSITGDASYACLQNPITHFVADCAPGPNYKPEVSCTCCTLCCSWEDASCNDSEWLGNPSGIYENGYQRVAWDFEDGPISPLVDYDAGFPDELEGSVEGEHTPPSSAADSDRAFTSRPELKTAVNACASPSTQNDPACLDIKSTYGWPMNSWLVGEVTDMTSLFFGKADFNEDISSWDVSRVTTMNEMFYYASSFNGNVSNFDTSKVTTMRWMFEGASSFNGDVSNFDTSSVTDMAYMFSSASEFNQDVSSFVTSSVTQMQAMFRDASAFNQNLCAWGSSYNPAVLYDFMFFGTNCPSQTDPSGLNTNWCVASCLQAFADKAELQTAVDACASPSTQTGAACESAKSTYGWPMGTWQVGAVTDMSSLFFAKNDFNEDISSWDVSQVRSMGGMFHQAAAFNQPLSFNTSSVTRMDGMFYNALSFNQYLAFDTSRVTTMRSMFASATRFNGDVSSFDTSRVTDMSFMFRGASAFDKDLSNMDTSKVSSMSRMFSGATAFNGDVSSFDTSSVTDMSYVFDQCSSFNGDVIGTPPKSHQCTRCSKGPLHSIVMWPVGMFPRRQTWLRCSPELLPSTDHSVPGATITQRTRTTTICSSKRNVPARAIRWGLTQTGAQQHATAMRQFRVSIDAYCGQCIWKNTSFNCEARVAYMKNQYQLTEEQAQLSLVETGECIDPDLVP